MCTRGARECLPTTFPLTIRGGLLLGIAVVSVQAQSNGILTGRVTDPSDRIVVGAEIVVRDSATLAQRSVRTNREGIYEIPALPVGVYRMQAKAPGFRLYKLESLTMEGASTLIQDVHLQV